MSKEDNLKEELQNQISNFDRESRKHKDLFRLLRYTTLVLTGSATVLASVALTYADIQSWLNMIIVVVTASAGVITSIEGLRKPAELWIHERNVLYELKDLQREINYQAAATGTIQDTDNYFQQLQQILGSSKEKWTKQVLAKNPSNTND